MESETVEAATPATETPATEKSFDERLLESIETKLADGAATDSATDAAAATETDETPAAEATTETPAVETKTETAPEPFTAEQMGDPAFFDKLDKAGWERLNQLHPALYAMGKQVASARGKANAALRNAPPAPVQERSTETADPEVSAEMLAALEMADSLDYETAAKGKVKVARLAAQEERQRERQQQDASQKEARELYASAYEMAVEELPELAGIPDKELDAEFDGSPRLTRKLNAATTHSDPEQRKLLVADVMAEAGRSVVAKRQAAAEKEAKAKADQKKADDQKRLRSNASNPSAAIAETQSGKAPRKGPANFARDGLASIQAKLDAQRAGGN